MGKLAINGGIPVRQGLLPKQITIGIEEKQAVNKVLERELLSGFRGNSSPAFYGGEFVKELEYLFSKKHNILYTYSCNSCTSALQITCGAIGLQPGDEVIVTPWSMTCSATAPMIWGAIPVFADIEYDYFCLNPESIEEKITERTKAIIVVDLFGQPYNVEKINQIANKYNLFVIEDAAQAIGSTYNNKFAGTLGSAGCFSFTQGKHLTAGEGGMFITHNPLIARNFSLIRNHAEAVISDLNTDMIQELNMIGFNMRLTEIQAAILIEQFAKLDHFIKTRQENAFYFANELEKISCIKSARIRPNCTHSVYVQAFFYNQELAKGIHRDDFIRAVKAELQPQQGRVDKGVPIGCGYIQPLYRMPLFQNNMHWSIKNKLYPIKEFPIVEKLWEDELFVTTLPGLDLNNNDRQDIVDAFNKVVENLDEIKVKSK